MKNIAFLVAGITAAMAVVIAKKLQTRRPIPVERLAHELEAAWADHHTKV